MVLFSAVRIPGINAQEILVELVFENIFATNYFRLKYGSFSCSTFEIQVLIVFLSEK